ncbi:nucleotidyltransferase domain-containing protein [Agarilytica rhodophyticola]|uniref:nucleotidyltransferase domain-containing protein n=1 Tax=Agarilytica rhodophyticola TaxID=1737490 RepID=UPI000B345E37|nr:nucleotidyltransferase domain-containing protein [Agarilytica rhodophyticola]
MIQDKKREDINRLLKNIENDKNINVILAVESGSRAWGFPSLDSDYDIRIIYCHTLDWYLSAFKKKDVIENVFIDDLDVSGWDIAKSINLMHKGNAALCEWLYSPIVYKKDDEKLSLLKELVIQTFNPKLVFHHYISLAKKKLFDEKNQYNAKGFLYGLRALLCAKWIKEDYTIPPVEFSALQKKYLFDESLRNSVAKLLVDKELIKEHDSYTIPINLYNFSLSEYDKLKDADVQTQRVLDISPYDNVLKKIVGANSF